MQSLKKKSETQTDPTSVTIKLKYPIDFDSQTYTEITLKRPKGKHLKDVSAAPKMADLQRIAVRLTGYSNRLFEEMDAVDYMAVITAIGDFLADGRETGNE